MPDKPKTDKFKIITPHGDDEGDKPKKKKFVTKTECDRCGCCCSGSTPSLHKEDIDLFNTSILSFDNTFTIRKGELFSVPGDQETYRSFIELIKITPKEGTEECIFYSANKGCTIYEKRPSQCAAYACWGFNDALTGLEAMALGRKDLFGDVELIFDIIDRHDERCSYEKLADLIETARGGAEAAAEEISEMLQYDAFIRDYVTEKFNIPESSLDLLLGKPMTGRISEFGLKVEREGDEFIIMPLNNVEGK
ncbi:MAG: YkgJ family cysteine cluster protein [Dissulfurispiraceae bacterium]